MGRDSLHIGGRGAVRAGGGGGGLPARRRARPARHRHGAVGLRSHRGRRPAAADAAGEGHADPRRSTASAQPVARRFPGPRPTRHRKAPRAGRNAQAVASQPAIAPAATLASAGAVSIDGSRWREADAGAPIPLLHQLRRPVAVVPRRPGAGAPDGARRLDQSGAERRSCCNTTGSPHSRSEGPWNSSIPSNSVVISFEDPDNEIDDPVLALTATFSNAGAGGTLHGTTFDGLTDAAIKFQNAAYFPASFRQSLDFTRVLTHEVGHSIGLAHTQNDGTALDPQADIMFATCCSVASPTPPALGPDDPRQPHLPVSGWRRLRVRGRAPHDRRVPVRELRLLQDHDLPAVWLERGLQRRVRHHHVGEHRVRVEPRFLRRSANPGRPLGHADDRRTVGHRYPGRQPAG